MGSKMKQPEALTTAQLKPYFAEYIRRVRRGKPGNPPILKPCQQCGQMLTARQRRAACVKCGTYNREVR